MQHCYENNFDIDQPVPPGPIDIHTHLLPGIDDGCQTVLESIEAINLLKAAGFTGAICTPHIWPYNYPHNTTEHIYAWTMQLTRDLQQHDVEFVLWPGGELHFDKDAMSWLTTQPVPTLAGSNFVLFDFWEDKWPAKWLDEVINWLFQNEYQPVLAHPERYGNIKDVYDQLIKLCDQGVMLQGNLKSITGEELYLADQLLMRLINEDRYTFLASDTHGPDSIHPRIEGINIFKEEYGQDLLDTLINQNPRTLILRTDA